MRSLKDNWASPHKLPSWLGIYKTKTWFDQFFPTECQFDKFSMTWQSSFELTFRCKEMHGVKSTEDGYGIKFKGDGHGFNMRFILEMVEDTDGK
jgi:hypothetical protein